MSLTVNAFHRFSELPAEVQVRILGYLAPEDLGRLALVSRAVYRLAYSNPVWAEIYRNELGDFPTTLPYRTVVLQSWKESASALVPRTPHNPMSLVAQRRKYQERIEQEIMVENIDPQINAYREDTAASELLKKHASEPALVHVIFQGAVLSGGSRTKSSFDIALEKGYSVHLLRLLVAKGARPSTYRSSAYPSSVDYALQSGCSLETLNYLITELNAPLTQAGQNRQSSLDRAIQGKQPLSIIKLLLDKGIHLTLQSTSEVQSTLDLAVSSNAPMEIIALLFEKGAQPTFSTRQTTSTLEHAIRSNYPLEDLKYLYNRGARLTPVPGFYNPDKGEILFSAMENKMSEDAILWLLEIGANPHLRSSLSPMPVPGFWKYSSLDYALKQGYGMQVIRAFYEKGIEISPEGFSMQCATEGECSSEVLDFLERPSKRQKHA